jgi:hypothetical protein
VPRLYVRIFYGPQIYRRYVLGCFTIHARYRTHAFEMGLRSKPGIGHIVGLVLRSGGLSDMCVWVVCDPSALLTAIMLGSLYDLSVIGHINRAGLHLARYQTYVQNLSVDNDGFPCDIEAGSAGERRRRISRQAIKAVWAGKPENGQQPSRSPCATVWFPVIAALIRT